MKSKLRVNPYTWDHQDGTSTDGYQLRIGPRFLFVAEDQVYAAADALIDAHENKGK